MKGCDSREHVTAQTRGVCTRAPVTLLKETGEASAARQGQGCGSGRVAQVSPQAILTRSPDAGRRRSSPLLGPAPLNFFPPPSKGARRRAVECGPWRPAGRREEPPQEEREGGAGCRRARPGATGAAGLSCGRWGPGVPGLAGAPGSRHEPLRAPQPEPGRRGDHVHGARGPQRVGRAAVGGFGRFPGAAHLFHDAGRGVQRAGAGAAGAGRGPPAAPPLGRHLPALRRQPAGHRPGRPRDPGRAGAASVRGGPSAGRRRLPLPGRLYGFLRPLPAAAGLRDGRGALRGRHAATAARGTRLGGPRAPGAGRPGRRGLGRGAAAVGARGPLRAAVPRHLVLHRPGAPRRLAPGAARRPLRRPRLGRAARRPRVQHAQRPGPAARPLAPPPQLPTAPPGRGPRQPPALGRTWNALGLRLVRLVHRFCLHRLPRLPERRLGAPGPRARRGDDGSAGGHYGGLVHLLEPTAGFGGAGRGWLEPQFPTEAAVLGRALGLLEPDPGPLGVHPAAPGCAAPTASPPAPEGGCQGRPRRAGSHPERLGGQLAAQLPPQWPQPLLSAPRGPIG